MLNIVHTWYSYDTYTRTHTRMHTQISHIARNSVWDAIIKEKKMLLMSYIQESFLTYF